MSTTLEHVPTGTYALDPVHSSFAFGVKYNIGTFRSSFGEVDAELSDGVLTGSAKVSSINIDQPQFKGHLLSPDFFDAEANPEVTFRSTEIRPSADGTVEVDGELTIRGVTKAVTATGSYSSGPDAFGNERAGFAIETTVDRREFGLNWQNPLPNGKDSLAWEVIVSVDLQFVKQG
ncbi:MAG TPA: YceI family protein [Solirubrobacteraceae bacterium]|jgi:polyisoprenoid-binding protein YceI|nr:YceI family protein [Solirubrobacteraceae bacterium]